MSRKSLYLLKRRWESIPAADQVLCSGNLCCLGLWRDWQGFHGGVGVLWIQWEPADGYLLFPRGMLQNLGKADFVRPCARERGGAMAAHQCRCLTNSVSLPQKGDFSKGFRSILSWVAKESYSLLLMGTSMHDFSVFHILYMYVCVFMKPLRHWQNLSVFRALLVGVSFQEC